MLSNVTCEANNDGLVLPLYRLALKELPQLNSSYNPVHVRHTEISQDQSVPNAKLKCFGNLFKHFQAGDTVIDLV